jgi:hypothetical protein
VSFASDAGARVRRARNYDQNAIAEIAAIGMAARHGNPIAKRMYAATEAYIRQNPPGRGNGIIDDIGFAREGESAPPVAPIAALAVRQPSRPPPATAAVPPLPPGALDGIEDPEKMEEIILKAFGHRDGLAACALALASGRQLTGQVVNEMGLSCFPTDWQSKCFFHGAEFSSEKDFLELAPHIDVPGRRALVVGQCIGYARRLQALRLPGSLISHFDPAVGWELGED